jgi:hypothetical protein
MLTANLANRRRRSHFGASQSSRTLDRISKMMDSSGPQEDYDAGDPFCTEAANLVER